MAKDSPKLFGVPIADGVHRQLERRKKIVSYNGKNDNVSVQEANLLKNKGGWVRLVSGINVVPDEQKPNYQWLKSYNAETDEFKETKEQIISNLKKTGNRPAKENVLHGGTLAYVKTSTGKFNYARRGVLDLDFQTNNKSTYYQDVNYGFRAMAGITSFEIKSKSTYGALKEAEITIQVNNLEQLDNVDMLFLRPGYDMLVEWGNSAYIDQDGKINTGLNSVSRTFLNGKSPTEILTEIQTNKETSGYNYDAMIGKVINFSWSYTQDGTYECSVKLMGRGELIESISSQKYSNVNNELLNYAIQNTPYGSSTVDKKDSLSVILRGLQYRKNDTIKDFKEKKLKGLKTWVYRSPMLLPDVGADPEEIKKRDAERNYSDPPETNYHWFITLRDLMVMLNELYIDKNPDTKQRPVNFSTDFRKTDMVTFNYHISSNPGICLLPDNGVDGWTAPGEKLQLAQGSFKKFYLHGYSFNKEKSKFLSDPNNAKTKNLIPLRSYRKINELFEKDELNESSPLNILVNVNHMLDIQENFIDEKKKNLKKDQVIIVFLKKILDDCSTALGGINALDLHHEEETNTWHVVDRNVFGPSEKPQPMPRIDIVGLKSMITNFSLQSKISNAIATQLAIGASQSGLNQRRNENLLQFNRELVNRFSFFPPPGTTVTEEDEEKELEDIWTDVSNVMRKYFVETVYEPGDHKDIAIKYGMFAEIYSAKFRRKDRIQNKPTFFPGLLPLELNITMDGISGLKIGEAFTISPNILPTRYLDRVGFVITQLGHTVGDDNRWETDLTCMMFNLPATAVATEKEARELEEEQTRKDEDVPIVKQGTTPSNKPWSAAFISYCAKKADSNFPVNAAHTGYAQKLRSSSNWSVLDARTTRPKVGDIVLKPRNANPIKFTDAKWDKYPSPSHADIVVGIGPGSYTTIGGNLSNTVKKDLYMTSSSVSAGVTGTYGSDWLIVMRPKDSINIQPMLTAAEEEWRLWHPKKNNTTLGRSQVVYNEAAANKDDVVGQKLFARMVEYWKTVGVNDFRKDNV